MRLLILLACVALCADAGYDTLVRKMRAEKGKHHSSDDHCAEDLSKLSEEEVEKLFEELMREMGEEEEYNQEMSEDESKAKREEKTATRKELLKKAIEEKEKLEKDDNCTHSNKISRYSIMTPEEFAQRQGAKIPELFNEARKEGEALHERLTRDSGDPPKRVDHCAHTGKVEDQSGCGSCWAFAASHTMTGLLRLRDGSSAPIVRLSEQQAVDCKQGGGCNGGWMTDGWGTYKSYGASTDFTYPYAAKDTSGKSCQSPPGAVGLNVNSVNGVVPFKKDGGRTMKLAVAKGPVAVGYHVGSDFQQYGGGIYKGNSACQAQINHGMTVCGYDTDPSTGQEYWMVKNSYGKDWGENGYARVLLGSNVCHIEEYAMYPVLSTTKTNTAALCTENKSCSSDAGCNGVTGACKSGKCKCQTCHKDHVCQVDADCGGASGSCRAGGSSGKRFARQVSDNRLYCACSGSSSGGGGGNNNWASPTAAPTTRAPPSGSCPQGYFRCASESRWSNTDKYCIPANWKCDMTKDCRAGEDEQGCSSSWGGGGGGSSWSWTWGSGKKM